MWQHRYYCTILYFKSPTVHQSYFYSKTTVCRIINCPCRQAFNVSVRKAGTGVTQTMPELCVLVFCCSGSLSSIRLLPLNGFPPHNRAGPAVSAKFLSAQIWVGKSFSSFSIIQQNALRIPGKPGSTTLALTCTVILSSNPETRKDTFYDGCL